VGDQDLYETTVEVTVTRDSTGQVRLTSLQQAYLVVISGPRLGYRTALGEQPITIGRGTSCGFMLDLDSVSRQHARVEWNGAMHRIVDLGSTNGTFVNEARVGERALQDGDRVGIGKVLLKYLSGKNIEAAYHEEIQRLMRYDGLTGVFNKRHFEEALRAAMTPAKSASRAALIVFDLDHFKNVNDTWGHTAGDAVLRQVATIVVGQLSDPQLMGRVGGEEFAVLWTGADAARAHDLAERIRRAVETASFNFDGTAIPITVSLGVAETRSGDTAEAFFERADARLYEAKRSGRNRVC
jgi:diguanylate cyclase (GGDEF)-like protein